MSLTLMSMAFRTGLKPSLRLVLMCLADEADDDGRCEPVQARIAAKSGVAQRTVRDALVQLEILGHLSRRSRPGSSDLMIVHPVPAGGAAQIVNADQDDTPAEIAGVPRQKLPGSGTTPSPVPLPLPPAPPTPTPLPPSPDQPSVDSVVGGGSRGEEGANSKSQQSRQPKLPKQPTRLPEDWRPGPLTPVARKNAEALGRERVRRELEKFKDHYLNAVGKAGFALNWDAKWRTWLDNAVSWSKPENLDREDPLI